MFTKVPTPSIAPLLQDLMDVKRLWVNVTIPPFAGQSKLVPVHSVIPPPDTVQVYVSTSPGQKHSLPMGRVGSTKVSPAPGKHGKD